MKVEIKEILFDYKKQVNTYHYKVTFFIQKDPDYEYVYVDKLFKHTDNRFVEIQGRQEIIYAWKMFLGENSPSELGANTRIEKYISTLNCNYFYVGTPSSVSTTFKWIVEGNYKKENLKTLLYLHVTHNAVWGKIKPLLTKEFSEYSDEKRDLLIQSLRRKRGSLLPLFNYNNGYILPIIKLIKELKKENDYDLNPLIKKIL